VATPKRNEATKLPKVAAESWSERRRAARTVRASRFSFGVRFECRKRKSCVVRDAEEKEEEEEEEEEKGDKERGCREQTHRSDLATKFETNSN